MDTPRGRVSAIVFAASVAAMFGEQIRPSHLLEIVPDHELAAVKDQRPHAKAHRGALLQIARIRWEKRAGDTRDT